MDKCTMNNAQCIMSRSKNLDEQKNGGKIKLHTLRQKARQVLAFVLSSFVILAAGGISQITYASAMPSTYSHTDTSQTDFASGTLSNVTATGAGDLQLASGQTAGTRTSPILNISTVGGAGTSQISWNKTDATTTNATFARASAAYTQNGTQVVSGAPCYEAGKFGQAVTVEEGTTNIFTDGLTLTNHTLPVFGTVGELTISDLSINDGIAHVSYSRNGSTGSDARIRTEWHTIDKSQNYTLSFNIKAIRNGVNIYISGGVVDNKNDGQYCVGHFNGSELSNMPVGINATSTNIGNGYYRLSFTILSSVFTGSGTDINAWLSTGWDAIGEFEYYYSRPQLEQKPYATTFIDSTRAAEKMTIPTAGVFNKGNWTVEFVYTPIDSQVVASSYRHLWMINIDGNNYYGITVAPDGTPYVQVKYNGTFYQAHASAPLQQGISVTIAAKCDGTNLTLYINGIKQQSINYTEPTGVLPTNMYIGSGSGGTLQPNGTYDDLRISSRARTDAEILADYNSSTPLPIDSDTTYKMSFDNSLHANVGPVKVETNLSTDCGKTWAGWQQVTSGGAIPGITSGTDLSNARLQYRTTLSTADSTVTPKLNDLTISIAPTSPGVQIQEVKDLGNNDNASDIRIIFWEGSNVWSVASYKIIVASGTIDLTTAAGLPADRCVAEKSKGRDRMHLLYLPASLKSSTGEDIDGADGPYNVYVFTVAKSGYTNNLSDPISISLDKNNVGAKIEAATPLLMDAANNNNGSDLRVTFKRSKQETNLQEYRIIVSTGNLDLVAANNVAAAGYKVVAPTGPKTNYVVTLNDDQTDQGCITAIQNGTSYKVYVLAVGKNGYDNVLSTASKPTTLSPYVPGADTVRGLRAMKMGEGSDSSNIKVTFYEPVSNSSVDEYRIFIVPAASTLSEATAKSAASGRYQAVSPTRKGALHIITLNAGLRDYNGDAVRTGAYKVYVLTVAKSGSAGRLSTASGGVTLE